MISVNVGEHEIVVKKSRFIAYSAAVQSREEVKECVKDLKKKHYEARHVCCGFVLDEKGDDFGYDDDGEPSGTAGKPIYSAIAAAGASRTAIAVVRYFGGILLGAGGLTRTYRQAAAELIKKVGVTELLPFTSYTVEIGGDMYKTYKGVCAVIGKSDTAIIKNLAFGDKIVFTLLAREKEIADGISVLGARVEQTGTTYLTRSEIDHVNKNR